LHEFIVYFAFNHITYLSKGIRPSSKAPPKRNIGNKPQPINKVNNMVVFDKKKDFDVRSDKLKLKEKNKLDIKIKDNKRLISLGNSVEAHLI